MRKLDAIKKTHVWPYLRAQNGAPGLDSGSTIAIITFLSPYMKLAYCFTPQKHASNIHTQTHMHTHSSCQEVNMSGNYGVSMVTWFIESNIIHV